MNADIIRGTRINTHVFILSGFNSLHKINKTIIVGNIYDEFYKLSKVSEQYTPKIITSFHLNRLNQ